MAEEEKKEIPPGSILHFFDLFSRTDELLTVQIRTSRRTNELLEVLLGVRPAPPEVVIPPPPTPPRIPAVVPEWEAMRAALESIEEKLEAVTDYLSEEEDAPHDYRLMDILHRSALNGYIINGGPGDLNVKINRGGTIRVANGEILDFNVYFKRPLEIKEVALATPTSARYRILLW